jgi:toluene monooxygenase system protein A
MHLQTVIERFLGGAIQPPDVPGILAWMGITPEVAGNDAYDYRWAKDYATRQRTSVRAGSAR